MTTTITLPMDISAIKKILPHRYPFLLVDRITAIDIENGTIVGYKNVSGNEQFFQGHFPGAPIMPGVLIIEAIAQVGGVLVALKMKTDKIAVLLNIKDAKFRRAVKPGDVLRIECKEIHFSTKGGKIQAQAFVDDKVVTECEVTFALVDREEI